jgi:hypothetical protein
MTDNRLFDSDAATNDDLTTKEEQLVFKTQKEAVKYINLKGFKCSVSKFSNDAKRNLIPTNGDGEFEASALMGYGNLYCSIARKSADGAAARAALERMRADADLKRIQTERAKVKLEADLGNYVPRSAHEASLAARAAFFKREVETFVHRKGPGLIQAVGGDEGRLPGLVEWWKLETEAWMDAWAADAEFAAPDVDGAGDGGPDGA